MNSESLKKILKSLNAIKVSMHDVAETRVDEKLLDEAVALVKQCIEEEKYDTTTAEEVLAVTGKVLEKLPSIVALLKLFIN